jgi:hypothetical protein
MDGNEARIREPPLRPMKKMKPAMLIPQILTLDRSVNPIPLISRMIQAATPTRVIAMMTPSQTVLPVVLCFADVVVMAPLLC